MFALLEIIVIVVGLVAFGLWWGDQPSSAKAKVWLYKGIARVKSLFNKV